MPTTRLQLNATKKEIVDTDALIERYRKEIEDLKRRLAEREAAADFGEGGGKVASIKGRRLSAREVCIISVPQVDARSAHL